MLSYLSNATAAEAQPPGGLALVVDLEVVDAVGGHGLDNGHVVDHALAPGLAFRFPVDLDHLVFAKGQGRVLFQHTGGKQVRSQRIFSPCS